MGLYTITNITLYFFLIIKSFDFTNLMVKSIVILFYSIFSNFLFLILPYLL